MPHTIDLLNQLYLEQAEELNPYGFIEDKDLIPPTSLNDLIIRQEEDDRLKRKSRISFSLKYQFVFPEVNMTWFFAGHDRIHTTFNYPFTPKGELAVVIKQYQWIKKRNQEAGKLHSYFVRGQGIRWRDGF